MATADRLWAACAAGEGHGPLGNLIGLKLRGRTLSGQQGEVALAVSVLSRMTRTAKPVSVRVA